MPRICRYCYGLSRISIIPRITPIVFLNKILKHQRSNPDRHGWPSSCHGLAKDRQGFVTVSLRFFTDAPGLTVRGDSASEPGHWDLGFSRANNSNMFIITKLFDVPFLLPACIVVYCNPRVPMEMQLRNFRRVFDDVRFGTREKNRHI